MHFTMIRSGESCDQAISPVESNVVTTPEWRRAGRGRKRAGESRAAEIRGRLAAWRQTPETRRMSLRTLAAEMGCSHQLLGFYLREWDKWQGREHRRESAEIRARAKSENRELTPGEWARDRELYRARFQCILRTALEDRLRKIEAEAKAASFVLTKGQINFVKAFAQRGFPRAQAILQRCAGTKNGLRRGSVGALGRNRVKLSKNNLPRTSTDAAKSFRSE